MKLPKWVDAEARKAKRYDVVIIHWRDSHRLGLGWDRPREYVQQALRSRAELEVTCGFFLAVDDAYVSVVLNASARPDGSESVTDAMCIPHEAIRSFRIIEKKAIQPGKKVKP